MVQIVDTKPEVDDLDVVAVRVWRSPRDGLTAVGGWEHLARRRPGGVTLHVGPINPITDVFAEALAYAQQRSIAFLWVEDPEGLFPPSQRLRQEGDQ